MKLTPKIKYALTFFKIINTFDRLTHRSIRWRWYQKLRFEYFLIAFWIETCKLLEQKGWHYETS